MNKIPIIENHVQIAIHVEDLKELETILSEYNEMTLSYCGDERRAQRRDIARSLARDIKNLTDKQVL